MTETPTPTAPRASASIPTTPGFWLTVAVVVALDYATKVLAVRHLMPMHVPHPIIGE